MNHKMLLALCLIASLSQASALLRLTRNTLGKHRIMAGIAHFSSQAEKNTQLYEEMSKLIQAQEGVLAALKGGGNPMAEVLTPQGKRKQILYEFIKDDKAQKIAQKLRLKLKAHEAEQISLVTFNGEPLRGI